MPGFNYSIINYSVMFAHFCRRQDLDFKSITDDNYIYSMQTWKFKNVSGKKKFHKIKNTWNKTSWF